MSSLLVCAQPATGNPVSFVPLSGSVLLKRLSAAAHSRITPASCLEIRPSPELVSTGISQIDVLTGGLPRGCMTELYGPPSSGCTSILLSVVAAATRRQEACALIDVSNALDPHSAVAAGVDLQQLLWVRCETKKNQPSRRTTDKTLIKADMARMAQALKVTDLLVQSGGFGLIAIDLGNLPHTTARRIPLASWFRFRRTVENTPTVLLVVSQAPCAGTCASLGLRLEKTSDISNHTGSQLSVRNFQRSQPTNTLQQITVHNFPNWEPTKIPGTPAHARLLEGISIRVEVERSRFNSKPAQSDKTAFETRTAWVPS